MKTERIKTGGRLLTTALVAMLALIIVLHAGAITLTPNVALVPYTLAADSASGPLGLAPNQGVLVIGTNTTSGDRGVGQVSMLHISGQFLEWVGLNSPHNGTIAQGFSGTPGTRIVQIDYSGTVFLQVYSADYFQVVNTGTTTQTGNVLVIW
jgi:hypothetical protein